MSNIEMEIYNKYIGQITVAYKNDISQDKEGNYRCYAKRTKDRKKYLFKGFKEDLSDNIVLIECPKNVLAIEFEKDSMDKKEKPMVSTKEERKDWIRQVRDKALEFGLDFCIADHGGTSEYIYMFNLIGLPEGKELEAKKIIAQKLVPDRAQLFLDRSNIGKTLIPIINRPHWKLKFYNGAIHKIIEGKNPTEHKNDVSKLIIEQVQPKEEREPQENDLAAQVKASVSLKEVMSKLSFVLSKNPTECLWHGSKGKACFSYDDKEGLWHCFHCDRGGDLITLVMEDKKLDFIPAIKWLNDEFNLNLSIKTRANNTEINDLIGKLDKKQPAKDNFEAVEENIKELFKDQHGLPYATLRNNDHKEHWPIKSWQFKNFVTKICYENSGNVPNPNELKGYQDLLAAKAVFEGKTKDVELRAAGFNDIVYIDLCNDAWEVLEVSKSEIKVLKESPVVFRRFGHMQELKVDLTAEIKDFDLIFDFLNIEESDKILMRPYISCLFYPNIPYAMLIVYGSQGSAKSTSQKIIRACVDPSSLLTLSLPSSIKELVQQISHHYLAFYDNVGNLKKEVSDFFCRVVTGEGFSKRELYTDDEDIIYKLVRKIGFNGINIAGEEPDYLDRALLILLLRIVKTKRKPEKILWKEFKAAQPKISGAIIKVLQRVLVLKDSVKISELPRMADFALVAETASRAFGERRGVFLNSYWNKIGDINKSALEANPIGLAILEFMREKDEWNGTASELLTDLEKSAEKIKINTKAKGWPSNPSWLTRKINVVDTNLKEEGIEFTRQADGKRTITITNSKPEKTDKTAGESSEPKIEEEKINFSKNGVNGVMASAKDDKKTDGIFETDGKMVSVKGGTDGTDGKLTAKQKTLSRRQTDGIYGIYGKIKKDFIDKPNEQELYKAVSDYQKSNKKGYPITDLKEKYGLSDGDIDKLLEQNKDFQEMPAGFLQVLE